MRGIITMLVMASLFVVALMVAIPTMDAMLPIAKDLAPNYVGQLTGIHEAVVKYAVTVFLGTILLWAVLWILRTETQQVR